MRLLVDEWTGPGVVDWLRSRSHDVVSVYSEWRGAPDEAVLENAHLDGRVLITNDKDFGEKIFRERRPHCGVFLLRLGDERTASKIDALQKLLDTYNGDALRNRYVVVTEDQVRFAGS